MYLYIYNIMYMYLPIQQYNGIFFIIVIKYV